MPSMAQTEQACGNIQRILAEYHTYSAEPSNTQQNQALKSTATLVDDARLQAVFTIIADATSSIFQHITSLSVRSVFNLPNSLDNDAYDEPEETEEQLQQRKDLLYVLIRGAGLLRNIATKSYQIQLIIVNALEVHQVLPFFASMCQSVFNSHKLPSAYEKTLISTYLQLLYNLSVNNNIAREYIFQNLFASSPISFPYDNTYTVPSYIPHTSLPSTTSSLPGPEASCIPLIYSLFLHAETEQFDYACALFHALLLTTQTHALCIPSLATTRANILKEPSVQWLARGCVEANLHKSHDSSTTKAATVAPTAADTAPTPAASDTDTNINSSAETTTAAAAVSEEDEQSGGEEIEYHIASGHSGENNVENVSEITVAKDWVGNVSMDRYISDLLPFLRANSHLFRMTPSSTLMLLSTTTTPADTNTASPTPNNTDLLSTSTSSTSLPSNATAKVAPTPLFLHRSRVQRVAEGPLSLVFTLLATREVCLLTRWENVHRQIRCTNTGIVCEDDDTSNNTSVSASISTYDTHTSAPTRVSVEYKSIDILKSLVDTAYTVVAHDDNKDDAVVVVAGDCNNTLTSDNTTTTTLENKTLRKERISNHLPKNSLGAKTLIEMQAERMCVAVNALRYREIELRKAHVKKTLLQLTSTLEEHGIISPTSPSADAATDASRTTAHSRPFILPHVFGHVLQQVLQQQQEEDVWDHLHSLTEDLVNHATCSLASSSSPSPSLAAAASSTTSSSPSSPLAPTLIEAYTDALSAARAPLQEEDEDNLWIDAAGDVNSVAVQCIWSPYAASAQYTASVPSVASPLITAIRNFEAAVAAAANGTDDGRGYSAESITVSPALAQARTHAAAALLFPPSPPSLLLALAATPLPAAIPSHLHGLYLTAFSPLSGGAADVTNAAVLYWVDGEGVRCVAEQRAIRENMAVVKENGDMSADAGADHAKCEEDVVKSGGIETEMPYTMSCGHWPLIPAISTSSATSALPTRKSKAKPVVGPCAQCSHPRATLLNAVRAHTWWLAQEDEDSTSTAALSIHTTNADGKAEEAGSDGGTHVLDSDNARENMSSDLMHVPLHIHGKSPVPSTWVSSLLHIALATCPTFLSFTTTTLLAAVAHGTVARNVGEMPVELAKEIISSAHTGRASEAPVPTHPSSASTAATVASVVRHCGAISLRPASYYPRIARTLTQTLWLLSHIADTAMCCLSVAHTHTPLWKRGQLAAEAAIVVRNVGMLSDLYARVWCMGQRCLFAPMRLSPVPNMDVDTPPEGNAQVSGDKNSGLAEIPEEDADVEYTEDENVTLSHTISTSHAHASPSGTSPQPSPSLASSAPSSSSSFDPQHIYAATPASTATCSALSLAPIYFPQALAHALALASTLVAEGMDYEGDADRINMSVDSFAAEAHEDAVAGGVSTRGVDSMGGCAKAGCDAVNECLDNGVEKIKKDKSTLWLRTMYADEMYNLDDKANSADANISQLLDINYYILTSVMSTVDSSLCSRPLPLCSDTSLCNTETSLHNITSDGIITTTPHNACILARNLVLPPPTQTLSSGALVQLLQYPIMYTAGALEDLRRQLVQVADARRQSVQDTTEESVDEPSTSSSAASCNSTPTSSTSSTSTSPATNVFTTSTSTSASLVSRDTLRKLTTPPLLCTADALLSLYLSSLLRSAAAVDVKAYASNGLRNIIDESGTVNTDMRVSSTQESNEGASTTSATDAEATEDANAGAKSSDVQHSPLCLKTDIIQVFSNYSHCGGETADPMLGSIGVTELCLEHSVVDIYNMYIREWAVMAVRNLTMSCHSNQCRVRVLSLQGVASHAKLEEMGMKAWVEGDKLKVKSTGNAEEVRDGMRGGVRGDAVGIDEIGLMSASFDPRTTSSG